MKIEYHRKFKKHYRQRIAPKPTLEKRFKERVRLFMKNPRDSALKDHGLEGKKINERAFWITRDIRVVYKIAGDTVEFKDVGSHNQVY